MHGLITGPESRQQGCEASEISSADDRAAVLDWRLGNAHPGSNQDGPLSWLPGIPDRIASDPTWGPYLGARSRLITELADRVRLTVGREEWAGQPTAALPAGLIADVQVWRAATQVEPSDRRLTGPPQLGRVARMFQQQLDKRLAAAATDEDWRWRQLLAAEAPAATADSFLPELTERLSNLSRAGFDTSLLVRSPTAEAPLPDDHPAAALWWRILDQLAASAGSWKRWSRWRCETAGRRRWASTSTGNGSTSATWQHSPRTCSTHGEPTEAVEWTRSCSPQPAIWSRSSTNVPAHSAWRLHRHLDQR
jgi:hypothetical protein